jgi:hypothetical protein
MIKPKMKSNRKRLAVSSDGLVDLCSEPKENWFVQKCKNELKITTGSRFQKNERILESGSLLFRIKFA